jgi:hypothetical protein
MLRVLQAWTASRCWLGALAVALVLGGCSGGLSVGDLIPGSLLKPPAQSGSIGQGQVKVALILPLSGSGNAAVAAGSMRNAAELALAEFNNPDLQLLAHSKPRNSHWTRVPRSSLAHCSR